MYGRKFYRRRPRKYLRKRRVARKPGKKSTLRSFVKRVVDRKIETKQYTQLVASGFTCYRASTASGMVNNTFSLTPPITQGTGDGNRIGDRIDVKRFSIRYYACNYAMNNLGSEVRIVIFALKDYNASVTGTTLPNVEASNFLRSGAGTTSINGYLGNDHLLPINKNRIIVFYDKLHMLGENIQPYTIGATDYSKTMPNAKHYIKFDINLRKSMKVWRYDENGVNPNLPLNHDLWMAVLPNYADGSVGDATPACTSWCRVDIHYKDA